MAAPDRFIAWVQARASDADCSALLVLRNIGRNERLAGRRACQKTYRDYFKRLELSERGAVAEMARDVMSIYDLMAAARQ